MKRMHRFNNKPSHEKKAIIRWLLVRFLHNYVFNILGIPIAFIVLVLFFCVEPFRKIRFSIMPCRRIGHLTQNVDLFCRKQQLSNLVPEDTKHIFITESQLVANRYLLDMWKRYLTVSESKLLQVIYILSGWILKKTRFYIDLPIEGVEYYEFNNANPTLQFTEKEERKGEEFLRQMGLDPAKDWFACVYARDSNYLNEKFPNSLWAYHDYRNTNIESLRDAIEYIIDSGGYVIRVGTHVKQSVNVQHKNFIDYSTKFRNEFMDIYLAAKARFFLGSSAGIMDLARIFDVPQLVIDMAPIGYAPYGKNSLWIPKKIKKQDNGEYVRFREIIEKRLDKEVNGVRFMRLGYEYEDNTPSEILDATKEMLKRIEGNFNLPIEELKLLKDYHNLFPPGNPSRLVRTPIGNDFLKSNRELFL